MTKILLQNFREIDTTCNKNFSKLSLLTKRLCVTILNTSPSLDIRGSGNELGFRREKYMAFSGL